jgi:serine/threonine-protein kinase
MARRAARRALSDAGFSIRERRQNDLDVPKGHVIRSQPGGGEQAPLNSVVTIYVSLGPPDAAVPDVTGQNIDDARSTLDAAHFDVKTVAQDSTDKDPGTVLSQDPAGGTSKPEGSTITLTVAKAPDQVAVPDETGKQATDAVRDLSQAGFTVVQKPKAVNNPDDDGVVLSQSPSGGRNAKPKSTVEIVVGKFSPDLNPEGNTTATTPTTTTTPAAP